MAIRQPVVAGRFYPSAQKQAQTEAMQCLTISEPLPDDLPEAILAAIVPHAGWMCSGAVAGRAIRAIAKSLSGKPLEAVVLFGAVHWPGVRRPAIDASGRWQTPLGMAEIDGDLSQRILSQGDAIVDAPGAHDREHSIEVIVPLVQAMFPGVRIVPIAVPPTEDALAAGRQVALAIQQVSRRVICIGSTDLTHYGPDYRFTPKGSGPEALRWAKDVNDGVFLQAIEVLDAPRVLKLAADTGCACGAGAVAATIAAAVALGAESAVVLQHTTSSEVLADRYGPDMQNSVGYASIVLGR